MPPAYPLATPRNMNFGRATKRIWLDGVPAGYLRTVPNQSGSSGRLRPAPDTFAGLAPQFAQRFNTVRQLVDPRYVRADWAERNARLERDLLPIPPADFLRHPAIRYQMFVNERVLPYELPFVRAQLGSDRLLFE